MCDERAFYFENGFQEVIYQRALEIEMADQGIFFVREFEMPIYYKAQQSCISVELKALIQLEDVHLAQAINYLEAYNLEVGLLINFGSNSLEFKRLTNKKFNPRIQ